MRFENKSERDLLIKSFEEKAKQLEQQKKEDKNTDKNYNCKVIFDTRTEYDSNVQVKYDVKVVDGIPQRECTTLDKDEEGNELPCAGEIYVFYIRQPKLYDTCKILEAGKPGGQYEKLILAWDAMIDQKESSPEILTDRIKLGYLPKMLNHIDALMGDQKKN